ncbi:MAG: helix-turn-helix domain-containing protein [Streptosporangiales bacterium]|nr:helix-turn-helix domain-containing protein [Streptosporangiales bacterium]
MEAVSQPTLIASVQRALRLLEAASRHANGAPAKRLAREAQLPLPTAYHLLRTLVHEGYLRRLEEGVYILGDRVEALSQNNRAQTLISRVRPVLAGLRDQLQAATYLSFYQEGEITVAEIVDAPRIPRVDLWVGMDTAGHATALGKSVLGHLDGEARSEYLSRHPMYELTPYTKTRQQELFPQLEHSRELAVDDEEYALGTGCLAVPVLAPGLLGSLGISCPSRRLDDMRDQADVMRQAAARITRALSLTV